MVLPVRNIYMSAVKRLAESEKLSVEPTKMAHGGLMKPSTKQASSNKPNSADTAFAYFAKLNTDMRNNRKNTKA
jgi:hypothetical protein